MAGRVDVGFAAGRTGITRRDFLKGTGMVGAACLAAPLLSCGSRSESWEYGTIIRNGTVYDGTLAEPVKADVGIVGDRIVAVGKTALLRAPGTEGRYGGHRRDLEQKGSSPHNIAVLIHFLTNQFLRPIHAAHHKFTALSKRCFTEKRN